MAEIKDTMQRVAGNLGLHSVVFARVPTGNERQPEDFERLMAAIRGAPLTHLGKGDQSPAGG